jgi:hypothetical protein
MKTMYYKNGKFNRSEIMKDAWQMAKKESLEMSLSTALKVVWSIAKNQQKEELAKIELEKKEAKMSPAELAESMGLIF